MIFRLLSRHTIYTFSTCDYFLDIRLLFSTISMSMSVPIYWFWLSIYISGIANENSIHFCQVWLAILNTVEKNQTRKCNCNIKETCPLQGICLSQSLVYRAHITNNSNNHATNYIGLTAHTFKDCLHKHHNTFRHRNKINSTQLSKYIWNQRNNNNSDIKIKLSILDGAPAFQNGSKRCEFCLSEKHHIIFQKYDLLNKQNELLSKRLPGPGSIQQSHLKKSTS